MIHHNHFKTFLVETYGTSSALLLKDEDPSSPTGLRPWKATDTANLAKWLGKHAKSQPVAGTNKAPGQASGEPFCLNVRQAAEKAGVGIKTIRSWTTKSTNPLPHMRDGRRVIIPIATFTDWLQQESLATLQHSD